MAAIKETELATRPQLKVPLVPGSDIISRMAFLVLSRFIVITRNKKDARRVGVLIVCEGLKRTTLVEDLTCLCTARRMCCRKNRIRREPEEPFVQESV